MRCLTSTSLGHLLAGLVLATAGAVVHAAEPASGTAAAELTLQARAFEHGEGVARDPGKAFELYCEAARAGDAEAQYSLGWMLANGRGIARDDAQAAYFFAMAARQQHVQARNMLRHVGESPSAPPPCMVPKPVVAEAEPEAEQHQDQVRAILSSAPPEKRKTIALLVRLAPEYGVNPLLALAIAKTESNLNPDAVSPKNAQGLMQLIPETSVRFNVSKPFDPEQNIRGGLAYLRWLLAYFRGKVALVAAAYNAGEGAVNRHRGIPPYAETQGYVRRILENFRKDSHPFDSRVTEPSPELARIRVAM